jgi:hypothetical protein
MSHNAVTVFTGRGPAAILREGGTQAWVLDPKRTRLCEFAVCTQNRKSKNHQWHPTEPHGAAFLVGRISEVVPSPEDREGRWLIRFSEYARVQIPDVWPGTRNPVWYTTLEELKIDPAFLTFEPMPEVEAPSAPDEPPSQIRPLNLVEAKQGLAAHFGVSMDDITITIKG